MPINWPWDLSEHEIDRVFREFNFSIFLSEQHGRDGGRLADVGDAPQVLGRLPERAQRSHEGIRTSSLHRQTLYRHDGK